MIDALRKTHPEATPAHVLARVRHRCIPTQSALLAMAGEGATVRIQTLNLHHLFLAKTNPDFRRAILSADAVTADGWPVAWAFRQLGTRVDRVTGSDLIVDLVNDAHPGMRVALIGTSSAVGEQFKTLLRSRGLELVLQLHSRADEWDPVLVAEALRREGASLVLVAVTPPKGDCFAAQLREAGVAATVIGVGGGIDMLLGEQVRAPMLWRRARLEWLFRMAKSPRRLGRRYVLECLPTFLSGVLPLALTRRHGG